VKSPTIMLNKIQENLLELIEFIQNSTAEVFKKIKTSPKINKHQVSEPQGFTHCRWFDKKCKFARAKLRRIIRRCGKDSFQYRIGRKAYKKITKFSWNEFLRRKCQDLESLEITNPRQHWKLFTSGFDQSSKCPISLKQWYDHFQNLFSSVEQLELLPESEQEIDQARLHIHELDKDISLVELRVCIQYFMKYNKACGVDGVYNNFIKWSMDWLAPILLNIFNAALKYEFTPESWSQQILIPIFKKHGNKKDPNSYRGIALLSAIGKLFGLILNNRLYKWAEENGKLCPFQGGFRRKRGCLDQCFMLLAVTQIQLKARRKTFACFVDFQKAYDSVQHAILWQRLVSAGISTKSLNLLKSLFKKISCTVKTEEGFSIPFNIGVGLRQGCVLSPLLFNLFINEITKILRSENHPGIQVGELFIFALLYADDLVLVADSQLELQELLKKLEIFCQQSMMKVNIKKTNVVIFSKRQSQNQNEIYFFNGQTVNKMESYVYLGTIFSSNGKFIEAAKQAVQKARVSEILFWKYVKKFKFLSVNAIVRKFNQLVLPVLLYNCEIWGPMITDSQMESIVETFYRKSLKRILGVSSHTPNSILYSILGCAPITGEIRYRTVKFYVEAMTTKEKINCKMAIEKLKAIGHQYWCFIESSIPEQDRNLNFEMIDSQEKQELLFATKEHIFEKFIARTTQQLEQSSKCLFYNQIFKPKLFGTKHFFGLKWCHSVQILTRLLCSSHKLLIETGRWQDIPTSERTCRFCLSEAIEDELHVMAHCHSFSLERKYFLGSESMCLQELVQVFNEPDLFSKLLAYFKAVDKAIKGRFNMDLFC
jgi:hypothetical protein